MTSDLLSPESLTRYSRQILLPQIALAGQKKLQGSRVLIVGLGGLGSVAAYYLAAAGIGHLILNDFDSVELSNLQRQILHNPADINCNKAISAKQQLQHFNPSIRLTAQTQHLDDNELLEEVAKADVVLDCSDNLHTRLRINQACFTATTALVSAAAIRFEGQYAAFDFRSGQGPCYCCFQSDSATTQSCASSGVVAPLVGVIGSHQAMECIKLIVNESADEKIKKAPELALYDGMQGRWRYLALTANPRCKVCSEKQD